MAFTVPPLPFAMDALEPYMSSKTLSYHYGKHNKAYNDTLNNLIKGTDYETMPLEEIIRTTQSGPIGGGQPTDVIAAQINAKWGSYDAFADAFTKSAVGNFGSGWTWLVEKEDGTLDIVNTSNAGTPITGTDVPLITCDVWEHAYYLDYYNMRVTFVQTFLQHLVNWDFAAKNYK